MHRKIFLSILFVAGIQLFIIPTDAFCNDSAAALKTQGLELLSIDGVKLRKEVLTIKKVLRKEPINNGRGMPTDSYTYPIDVGYEFENITQSSITTLVAFPLPPKHPPGAPDLTGLQPFIENFILVVNGKNQSYHTEHKAIARGKDVTSSFIKYNIDYASFAGFGGFESRNVDYKILSASKIIQEELKSIGAVDEMLFPSYEVKTTFFWKQTFPPNTVTRISHAYDASPGFGYHYSADNLTNDEEHGCVDDSLKKVLTEKLRNYRHSQLMWDYVDYILTTAGSWGGKIQSFELNIHRPEGHYVSLCWPGKVEKIGGNRFRIKANDFQPTRELKVFWYHISK